MAVADENFVWHNAAYIIPIHLLVVYLVLKIWPRLRNWNFTKAPESREFRDQNRAGRPLPETRH